MRYIVVDFWRSFQENLLPSLRYVHNYAILRNIAEVPEAIFLRSLKTSDFCKSSAEI